MRRLFIVALAVAVIAVVFGALALGGNDVSAAKEKSPIVGNWEAIDPYDESYMQMKITPGLTFMLVDDWASACGEPDQSGTMKGKVELIDPSYAEGVGQVRCTASHVRWEGPVSFESIGFDELLDGSGVVWTRLP